jgi:hypothetical protein
MTINLKNRNFLKLLDYTPAEIQYLIDLAIELKAAKKAGREKQTLVGKNIALIFEKTSTRTRCAFEVGAFDQGAQVTYLGPSGSQIGHKESMKDTARVLGRMYDGIEYRGYGQAIVEELGEYAGVPVWNGLTDEFHHANPRRPDDHAGARAGQNPAGAELCLPGRRAQQHGQLADGRRGQDGDGYPPRGTEILLAGSRAG